MPIALWPEGTKEIIEEIIGQIGREVEFVQVTYSSCPACMLDPITNTSTNSFCDVCSGLYWIPLFSGVTISAHVTWKPSDILQWESGGQMFTGDCLVKVMYTDGNYQIVNEAKYLVVDGKELNVINITLLGVPSINRILIETKEKEKEHGT
jgi:hypothetical protein